jgi:hypothetical protein
VQQWRISICSASGVKMFFDVFLLFYSEAFRYRKTVNTTI